MSLEPRHRPSRERAIVIGGSYAGLLAARVLADHFPEVVILERDVLDPASGRHPGAPQAEHPHLLLARGGQVLEALFPGLRDELAARGAPVFDFGTGFRVLYLTGWSPAHPMDLMIQSFTRDMLEAHVRERVLDLPGVSLRDGFAVDELLLGPDRRRITGVAGPDRSTGHRTALTADFVVEAGGRSSRLPLLLAEAGLPQPPVREVLAKVDYVSQLYRIPPGTRTDWKLVFETVYAPHARRGGAVVTVDDAHWQVCLLSTDGEPVPRTDTEVKEFAASLRSTRLTDAIAHAEPVGDTHHYRCRGNRWHRYDRVQHLPTRLAVLGDAFCTFNPIYGQGLTAAAVQAEQLALALTRTHDLDTTARVFQRHAARRLHTPWLLATSADLGWHPESASYPHRLAHRYLVETLHELPDNPALYRRFARVQHMLTSPLAVLRPRALLRTLLNTRLHGPR
ncbi:NAD(P)/FAD-dependent oxidoreductase [Kitasatospora sp. NPDC088134]|uniref:NAD(P)/FAD-dependent oxidoreductase n=1 Tax=Kitasatospora sp. NPDC088134 TaxID=3364071 RepID=UPI003817638C